MVTIYVDEREKNSRVPNILISKGLTIVFKMLEAGDYVISNYIGIERKSANDYLNSLIDGRLFDQLNRLKKIYEKTLLIIEGDIHKEIRNRNVHRNAIIGSYISILFDMEAYIITTRNEEETAEVIKRIAFHKPKPVKPLTTVHKPKISTVAEWQRYIIQCFPYIGPKIAQRVLETFGSIHNFCNASIQELTRIEGLSDKKAGELYQIIHAIYKDYIEKVGSEHKKRIIDYLEMNGSKRSKEVS
ncbi:MAG: ERCC4 domain-containing protein [Ignisphaera sp.]|uniref:Multidrug MFS transporter n=1 Tax=Ignisphaera aggregans TaxID=334771 RepID=A0A7J3MZN4_9CREN